MNKIRYRRFAAHKRGCTQVRAIKNGNKYGWPSAFVVISDGGDYCTFHPVKRGPNGTFIRLRWTYMVFRCNDINCPALIGIRLEDLNQLFPEY